MTIKLVLAGCGNMGYAMLAGWLKSGTARPRRRSSSSSPTPSCASAPQSSAQQRPPSAARPPGGLRADAGGACGEAAGDPRGDRRLQALRRTAAPPSSASPPARRIATFEEILGDAAPIVRCMPNTPAAIGKGMMVVLSQPTSVRRQRRRFVADLLSASGEVATIDDEGLMDAVTAVSGSGPAYVFHFIEALTAAAEKAGLPADTAKLLAMQTVYGAASLAAESGEDPGMLRQQVTSPNGTTAAALAC